MEFGENKLIFSHRQIKVFYILLLSALNKKNPSENKFRRIFKI